MTIRLIDLKFLTQDEYAGYKGLQEQLFKGSTMTLGKNYKIPCKWMAIMFYALCSFFIFIIRRIRYMSIIHVSAQF